MSKPDPAGGSLESILASIRKNLAEQSGEATSEAPATSSGPDLDAKPARRHGLSHRLAGTTAETTANDQQGPDDLSDLLESPIPQPSVAASAPVPASGAEPADDPLWFLTRHEDPPAPRPAPQSVQAPASAGRDAAAPARAPTPAPEPTLTRPEVLRASMPPFFGASTDSAAVQDPTVETPPITSEPAAASPHAPGATETPSIAEEMSLVAAAVESAANRPSSSPLASLGLNGRADVSTPPPSASPLPGDAQANRALEAVVLELLKPMLRQWLDENMPRLVTQAINEEAAQPRQPAGGGKRM